MSKSLQGIVQAGIEAGLLPPTATLDTRSERPWPVVLLTAVGAWFATVPLLAALGLLLGDLARAGVGPYLIGTLVLSAAVVVLRAKALPLFVEQLALPALLLGVGSLAMGLYRDFPRSGNASALLLLVVLGLAVAIPRNWLRLLLGALAAALLGQAMLPNSYWVGNWAHQQGSALLVLHALLVVWLLALWLQQRLVTVAALLEALAAGWLLTTLVGLVWLAGSTFLLGGVLGSNPTGALIGWIAGFERGSWQAYTIGLGSSLLVLVAAALGALAWPALRQWLVFGVALVLAGLAWFLPMLGATLLALMLTVTTQRWRQAGACALAASWVVGSFYYHLRWPLADKALLLVGAGVLLSLLAWLGGQAAKPATGTATRASAVLRLRWQIGFGSMAMLATLAATLLIANAAIWQKQDLIARGKPIYLALLPVDPRSLMQGDYMRLRFASLDQHQLPLLADLAGHRPHLMLQLDARGVATVQRPYQASEPLAANQMLLELTPKDGQWVVVTDAWFFKEGQGQRWQAAKFGEFRVLPDGRALLVGLADENLQAIRN